MHTNAKCANCGTTFVKKVRRGKHDGPRSYCSKKCVTKARKATERAIKKGTVPYRQVALEHYGAQCWICGYSVSSILEVHHRDHNRSNNDISNLVVLCPTHHKEVHKEIINLIDDPYEDEE